MCWLFCWRCAKVDLQRLGCFAMNFLRSSPMSLPVSAGVLDSVTVYCSYSLPYETNCRYVFGPANSMDNRSSFGSVLCPIFAISLVACRIFWIFHILVMDWGNVSAPHLSCHLYCPHQCHVRWYAMRPIRRDCCPSDYHYLPYIHWQWVEIHDQIAHHRCQLFPIRINFGHKIAAQRTVYSGNAICCYCCGSKSLTTFFVFHKRCAVRFLAWDRTFGHRADWVCDNYPKIFVPCRWMRPVWEIKGSPSCSRSIDDRTKTGCMYCSKCLGSCEWHRFAKIIVYYEGWSLDQWNCQKVLESVTNIHCGVSLQVRFFHK